MQHLAFWHLECTNQFRSCAFTSLFIFPFSLIHKKKVFNSNAQYHTKNDELSFAKTKTKTDQKEEKSIEKKANMEG